MNSDAREIGLPLFKVLLSGGKKIAVNVTLVTPDMTLWGPIWLWKTLFIITRRSLKIRCLLNTWSRTLLCL